MAMLQRKRDEIEANQPEPPKVPKAKAAPKKAPKSKAKVKATPKGPSKRGPSSRMCIINRMTLRPVAFSGLNTDTNSLNPQTLDPEASFCK